MLKLTRDLFCGEVLLGTNLISIDTTYYCSSEPVRCTPGQLNGLTNRTGSSFLPAIKNENTLFAGRCSCCQRVLLVPGLVCLTTNCNPEFIVHFSFKYR